MQGSAVGGDEQAAQAALRALRARVLVEAGLVAVGTLALTALDVRLDLVHRTTGLGPPLGPLLRHGLFALAVSHLLMLVFGARRARELRAAAGQRAAVQAQLEHRADHDPVTGLANRSVLDRAVAAALRSPAGGGPGLLRLGLRDLPEIGATLGHDVAEQVLQRVGRRVAASVAEEPGVLVASVGGTGLAVLVPDGRRLPAVTDTVLAAVLPGVDVGDLHLAVLAHAGTAAGDAATPAELLGRAEVALAAATARGVPVRTYDPALDRRDGRRLTMYGELRRGIAAGELRVHYQPKVALRTGTVTGVEALVRWQHPERGLLTPDAFLGVAEHCGLVPALTEAVLEQALTDHAAWAGAGLVVPVAVNLSARSLLDRRLASAVLGQVAAHGLRPDVLELEVTENAVMADPERARTTLQALRDGGFALAVDDYGTGQASLSYLSRLPITTLKIDRTFVGSLSVRPHDRTIVRSTVELGHGLGLAVVAEGVEDAATWAELGAAGCDQAQGFWLARPGAAAGIPAVAAALAARLAPEPVTP